MKVKKKQNMFQSIGTVLMSLALFGFIYNLIPTIESMSQNPGVSFFRAFFFVGRGAESIYWTLLVYGPLIAAPIGLVLYLIGTFKAKNEVSQPVNQPIGDTVHNQQQPTQPIVDQGVTNQSTQASIMDQVKENQTPDMK